MRCSSKYVGLDVHQATLLATVRDSSGRIIARSVLPTEEAALLEFFAACAVGCTWPSRKAHVAFIRNQNCAMSPQGHRQIDSPTSPSRTRCSRRGRSPGPHSLATCATR